MATPVPSLGPIPTINALTVWFTTFGPPQLFVADRGGEFHSAEVESFLKIWGVTPTFSEAYNPQANGQAEAAVKIASRMLFTALCDLSKTTGGTRYPYKAWVGQLNPVVMSYNMAPNRITGLSPYEIMFGRAPSVPLPHPERSVPLATEEALQDHLLALKMALHTSQRQVTEKLTERRNQIKRMFDKFRRPLTIEEGDYAYIYYPRTMMLPKLHPKAYGPFKVEHISRMPGTQEPVGITVNLGTEEAPRLKRFARARVHPLSYTHRDINWPALAKFADKCRNGTQGFIDNDSRPTDDAALVQGGQRRIAQENLIGVNEFEAHSSELINYIAQEQFNRLYDP